MIRNQFAYFASGVCAGWLGLTLLIWNSDNVKTIIKEVVCETTDNPLSLSETNLVNKMMEILYRPNRVDRKNGFDKIK